MSKVKLLLLENKKFLSELLVLDKKVITVGRGDTIKNQYVSRKHLQIFYNQHNKLIVQDLGSTHGTFLNNVKLIPAKEYLIEIGDKLSLAGSDGILILVKEESFSLKDIETGGRSTSILDTISKKKTRKVTIGRSQACDFTISGSTISREHAFIERKKYKGGRVYVITDNKSLNGTYVNGKKIKKPTIINKRDRIFIGSYLLTLAGNTECGGQSIYNLKNEVAIKAFGLEKEYVNNGKAKTVLQTTSFNVPGKSLLALMGPSGCGKSTLLKILLGDVRPTSGQVSILGQDLYSNFEYLKTRIGYVPQDDIIHKELTVYQSLRFTAKLRLDNVSDGNIEAKINSLLTKFGVQHIKHEKIAKISGGQRKRISIAVELLSDPDILFLDEPTSPLDPQTIIDFLDILRKLSQEGTTIVMVTHKPSDLSHMDRVIFMAASTEKAYYKGGGVAFYDTPKKYKSYFNVKTSGHVYKEISSRNAQKWINDYKLKNKISKSRNLNPNQKVDDSRVSNFLQFFWLTSRYFTIKLNDRMNSAIMLIQAPIIAILICIIFPKIDSAVLFISAISAIWFGCNNAAREIVGEKNIYRRERMYNLNILPYIFSKITVLSFFSIIQSALFILILTINFDPDLAIAGTKIGIKNGHHAFFWMSFLSISSAFLGLFLSSIMDTTEKVMTIVPIVLIPQIMLAGLVTSIHNSFIEFLSYFTLSRWGTEGFHKIQETINIKACINPNTGNQDWCKVPADQKNAVDNLHKMFDKETYADNFGTQAIKEMPIDIWAVLMMSIVFLVLIYIALKSKDTN